MSLRHWMSLRVSSLSAVGAALDDGGVEMGLQVAMWALVLCKDVGKAMVPYKHSTR